MKEYVAHLPDYTCRVTLERSTRRRARDPFELNDRIRLEVAYAGGQELYAWPGGERFESGIEDILPGHGMVTNGSFALHMRNLFARDVAVFSDPRNQTCDGHPCIRLDFEVPAARSGYSISAGSGSAPAALTGSAWFAPESLDIETLEVRVENTPKTIRIAGTREVTRYRRVTIGDAVFVLPASSETVLKDRDGSEARNHSEFDRYRRYAGSSMVFYENPAASADTAPRPAHAPVIPPRFTATLDAAITEAAAIGDVVPVFAEDGARYDARITGMRRYRKSWMVDLAAGRATRNGLPLPAAKGLKVKFE